MMLREGEEGGMQIAQYERKPFFLSFNCKWRLKLRLELKKKECYYVGCDTSSLHSDGNKAGWVGTALTANERFHYLNEIHGGELA